VLVNAVKYIDSLLLRYPILEFYYIYFWEQGIAVNGLLAKICGDIRKPNNQFYLEPTMPAIKEFMRVLPIRKVCGIGNVTEQMLKGLDVHMCGDVWEKRGLINLLFKPATVSFLVSVALGIGNCFLASFAKDSGGEDRKSVSNETTFSATSDRNALKEICKELCEELEGDIQRKGVSAKTITLKIKTHTFEVKTRAKTIAEYTASAATLFQVAWSIYLSYEREIEGLKIRLMGVRVSKLKFRGEDDNDDKPGCSSSKQATIEQMFANKTQGHDADEVLASFACPICELKFCSIRDLNLHIDMCITEDRSCEREVTVSVIAQNASETDVPHVEPDSGSDRTSVVCPICNSKFNFNSESVAESEMNSHIDLCLNQSTLKELRQNFHHDSSSGSPLVSGKRPSDCPNLKQGPTKKKKSASFVPIDSYFKSTG
jgi:hypothetical protein